MLNYLLAFFFGHLCSTLLSLIPTAGGSSLPGLIAITIDRDFLIHFLNKHPLKIILITGTNGKTTTSRILSHILNQANFFHLHNRSGSNLKRGVASTFIKKLNLIKKHSYPLALLEVDEFALNQLAQELYPDFILFTNLFRDQLDRYGEINTVLTLWLNTVKSLPEKTKIIVNIDDPSLNYLSQFSHRSLTFGLCSNFSQKQSLSSSADAIFCPQCLKPLKFSHIFTSHLGIYHCNYCFFSRNNPQFSLKKPFNTKLLGLHSQYNLLAASILAQALRIDKSVIKTAAKTFIPAFGREESFKLGSLNTQIILVKNPTGFNAILESLNQLKKLHNPLLIILNDNIADGTDVSWIWDINFDYLNKRQKPIIISGTRAYDLTLRLKYQNINPQLLIIESNIKKAVSILKQQPGHQAYILPTYTAMLNLRKILSQQKLIHSTWKD